MCVGAFTTCVSVDLVPAEARRGHWILWNWSYRWQWSTMWVLGTKFQSSARAASAISRPQELPFKRDFSPNAFYVMLISVKSLTCIKSFIPTSWAWGIVAFAIIIILVDCPGSSQTPEFLTHPPSQWLGLDVCTTTPSRKGHYLHFSRREKKRGVWRDF